MTAQSKARPRILMIEPVTAPVGSKDKDQGSPLAGLADIERVYLASGPRSVECEYDIIQAAPGILALTEEAPAKGYDAVVIDCFADPALAAARELVRIPVCGAGETCMSVAAAMAGRFSVVTVVENLISLMTANAQVLGVGGKLASVRAIDVPVLDIDHSDVVTPLVKEAIAAIDSDGAKAIALGCTGLVGVREAVERDLRQRGYDVPVIDPTLLPALYAFMLVTAGVAQSKTHYMFPPVK